MSWIKDLQDIVPWVGGLPLMPKAIISVITIAVSALFLLLVWTPVPVVDPATNARVLEAYTRMSRVLTSLQRRADGTVWHRDELVSAELAAAYYRDYLAIAEFLAAHPNDVRGAYEAVWEHGGQGRVHTSDTQALEAAVSMFFSAFEAAQVSFAK